MTVKSGGEIIKFTTYIYSDCQFILKRALSTAGRRIMFVHLPQRYTPRINKHHYRWVCDWVYRKKNYMMFYICLECDIWSVIKNGDNTTFRTHSEELFAFLIIYDLWNEISFQFFFRGAAAPAMYHLLITWCTT